MSKRKLVAGALTIAAIAGGYWKGVYEPNHLPDIIEVSSLPFDLPQKLAQTVAVGGETGLICPADANPCTKATALGTMTASVATVKTAYEDISPNYFKALIAREDNRFFVNDGCDMQGVTRAGTKFFLSLGKVVEGGSGIDRQVVDILDKTPKPPRSDIIKSAIAQGVECLQARYMEEQLAVKLGSKQKAKETVLETYANTVYFGRGAIGIEAAAQQYFGVHAKDLDVKQAAVLAGVVNMPSVYDIHFSGPVVAPNAQDDNQKAYNDFAAKLQAAKKSSDPPGSIDVFVAAQRQRQDKILPPDQADKIQYVASSIALRKRYALIIDDLATYYPEVIKPSDKEALLKLSAFPALIPYKQVSPAGISFKGADQINARHFTDLVLPEATDILEGTLGHTVSDDEVKSGRYTIYTTLNTRDQAALNGAIQGDKRTASLDVAAVSLDPDGLVTAMVGSKDYSKLQTNVAADGKRDGGSSNKPYALAYQVSQGVSATGPIPVAGSVTIEQKGQAPWVVNGHSGCSTFKKTPPCEMSPADAVAVSSNTWAAQTVKTYGINPIVEKMNALGMDMPGPYTPAFILGATATSPLKQAVGMNGLLMNSGKAVLRGNKGYTIITKIVDSRTGQPVYQAPAVTRTEVYSAPVAQAVAQALKNVVKAPYGTSYGMIKSPAGPESVGGKTGTAAADTPNDLKDLWWTAGIRDADPTRSTTVSVWAGHADAERAIGVNLAGHDLARIFSAYINARPHNDIPTDIAQ